MKKIEIQKKSGKPIIIYDDDNTNLMEYQQNLLKLFTSNKVCTIQIENNIVMVRPSEIDAIFVSEEIIETKPTVPLPAGPIKPEKLETKKEDVIKD